MLIYSMLQATEEAQSKETNVISIWGWDQRIKTGGFYLMWSRSCSVCGGYSSPWHEELFLNYLIFFPSLRWNSPSTGGWGGHGGGENKRLSTGMCCFPSTAATDDKCLTDYIHSQPYILFRLYIRDEPYVPVQKHPPASPHCGCGPQPPHPPTPLSRATGKLQLHTDTEGFCSLVSWYWWKSWEDWDGEDQRSCSLCTFNCPWR